MLWLLESGRQAAAALYKPFNILLISLSLSLSLSLGKESEAQIFNLVRSPLVWHTNLFTRTLIHMYNKQFAK
jgi:fumarate reductase subunit D